MNGTLYVKVLAEGLVAAVDGIGTAFWAIKGVEYSDPAAPAGYGA